MLADTQYTMRRIREYKFAEGEKSWMDDIKDIGISMKKGGRHRHVFCGALYFEG